MIDKKLRKKFIKKAGEFLNARKSSKFSNAKAYMNRQEYEILKEHMIIAKDISGYLDKLEECEETLSKDKHGKK